MKPEDIDRLERAALAQVGKPISVLIQVTPFELLELCRLAREAHDAKAASEGKPA
jgi:hypothetical protein